MADGQEVKNKLILGPTQELLAPFVATRNLHGKDYFEWCLRWNKLQYFLASKRAVPPQTIRGIVTTRHGYSEGGTPNSYWRPPGFGHRSHSTSRTREEVWQIGGYGGGPVTIYNPFVTR